MKPIDKQARETVLQKLVEFTCSINQTDSRSVLSAKLKAAEIVLQQTDDTDDITKPFASFIDNAKAFLKNMDPNALPTFGSQKEDEYPPNPLDGLHIEEEPEEEKR